MKGHSHDSNKDGETDLSPKVEVDPGESGEAGYEGTERQETVFDERHDRSLLSSTDLFLIYHQTAGFARSTNLFLSVDISRNLV